LDDGTKFPQYPAFSLAREEIVFDEISKMLWPRGNQKTGVEGLAKLPKVPPIDRKKWSFHNDLAGNFGAVPGTGRVAGRCPCHRRK
jgi:hypothetical protein